MVITTRISPAVTLTPATSPIVLEVVVSGTGAIGVDVMVEMILVDTGTIGVDVMVEMILVDTGLETKMKVISEDHGIRTHLKIAV